MVVLGHQVHLSIQVDMGELLQEPKIQLYFLEEAIQLFLLKNIMVLLGLKVVLFHTICIMVLQQELKMIVLHF